MQAGVLNVRLLRTVVAGETRVGAKLLSLQADTPPTGMMATGERRISSDRYWLCRVTMFQGVAVFVAVGLLFVPELLALL